MLISLVTQTLDEASVVGENRQKCTRLILMVLLKLSKYTNVKVEIRKVAGYEAERVIFKNLTTAMNTEALQLRLWRAFHGFVITQDEDHLQDYNMTRADLEFVKANLKPRDLSLIKNSELRWEKAPITQRELRFILKKSKRTIDFYSYKLRYVLDIDYSVDKEDFRADMIAHAILTVYHYESFRSIQYLVGVANKSIANYWRDQCDTWNAQKRTGEGRKVVDTGRKKADGSKIFEFDNHCIRAPLAVQGDDGEDMENPALSARSTEIESDIEVKDFIDYLDSCTPSFSRYLKVVVLDQDDEECSCKLRETLKPLVRRTQEREDNFEERFRLQVEKIVGVTDSEKLKAMREFRKHFGAKSKLIQRTIRELNTQIKQKRISEKCK